MPKILKVIIRTVSLFIYFALFIGLVFGVFRLHVTLISPGTIEIYTDNSQPSDFVILIAASKEPATTSVTPYHLKETEQIDSDWRLYQTAGKGRIEGNIHKDPYDYHDYLIETLSNTHARITVERNNDDGKVRYIYEVEDNKVYPQSRQLLEHGGWMVASFLIAIPLVVILIVVLEKFLVRRIYTLIGF